MESYAADHVGLLDHLKISQCHLMGGCIGSSYCLGVIKSASDRVSARGAQNSDRAVGDESGDVPCDVRRVGQALPAAHAEIEEAGLRVFERGCTAAISSSMCRGTLFGACERTAHLDGSDDYHPTPTSERSPARANAH